MSIIKKIEYRNQLKKEINEIINKDNNNNLYSASDLIKLKEKENRELEALYLAIKEKEKNIKSIYLYMIDSKLRLMLIIREALKNKKLILSSDSKGNILNEPIAFNYWDVRKVIWNNEEAKQYIEKYRDILKKLVDFGYDNLVNRETISNLNSKHFLINYNQLNYLMYLYSTDQEFLFTRKLDKNRKYDDEFKGSTIYDEEIQRLKENKNNELDRFLDNIQFSEFDISDNLNKKLIKLKK